MENSELVQNKQTIWVIPAVHGGVVHAIYSNAPEDMEIRAFVLDVDKEHESYPITDVMQDYLSELYNQGTMRDIDSNPHWSLLEPEKCLCYAEHSQDDYQFVQVCKSTQGGFTIAETGLRFIRPVDHKGILGQLYKKRCIRRFSSEPEDWRYQADEGNNPFVAACLFQNRIKLYMRHDLHFETFEQARAHIAVNMVDCFIHPEAC